jgi:hypothetical protein
MGEGSKKAVTIVGVEERRAAGKRLRAYVEDRMGAEGIASLVQLAESAPVSYDTLHAWFRGRPPSVGAGGNVARVLGVSYNDLMEAYEGRPRNGGRVLSDEALVALVEEAVARALARGAAEDPRDIRIRRAHAAPLHRRHDDPQ